MPRCAAGWPACHDSCPYELPAMTRGAIRHHDTRQHIALAMAVLGGAAAIAWVAGFLWFVRDAVRPVPTPPTADGILALTGGADRVATAITLLRDNRAR